MHAHACVYMLVCVVCIVYLDHTHVACNVLWGRGGHSNYGRISPVNLLN